MTFLKQLDNKYGVLSEQMSKLGYKNRVVSKFTNLLCESIREFLVTETEPRVTFTNKLGIDFYYDFPNDFPNDLAFLHQREEVEVIITLPNPNSCKEKIKFFDDLDYNKVIQEFNKRHELDDNLYRILINCIECCIKSSIKKTRKELNYINPYCDTFYLDIVEHNEDKITLNLYFDLLTN